LRLVKLRRQFHDLVQGFALFFPRLVVGRPSGKFHSGFGGQLFHRFGKAQAFGFHQPFEGVAAHPAAETFVGMALILDLETGGFFAVKGAAAPHHPAFADQLDPASHELDQIGPPPDLLQHAFAIPHGLILSQKARKSRENRRLSGVISGHACA
jgi:hypothetical protein